MRDVLGEEQNTKKNNRLLALYLLVGHARCGQVTRVMAGPRRPVIVHARGVVEWDVQWDVPEPPGHLPALRAMDASRAAWSVGPAGLPPG